MALNVVMLGPPASGKGTQAVRLAQARGIPKISTGDILREAAQSGSELGLRAKALMDRGELLGDDEMIGIVKERLARAGRRQRVHSRRFSADGAAGRGARSDAAGRAAGRHRSGGSGRGAAAAHGDAPRVQQVRGDRRAGIGQRRRCDRCGGEMITRADDGDEQVRQHRLEVYARESKPLLDYYRGRRRFARSTARRRPIRSRRSWQRRSTRWWQSARGSGR